MAQARKYRRAATTSSKWLLALPLLWVVLACDPVRIPHSQVLDLPASVWRRNTSLTFTPQYRDSASHYEIRMTLGNDSRFAYRNLPMAVDLMDCDSVWHRQVLNVVIADGLGNYRGAGFAAVHQVTFIVASPVLPHQACKLRVWQMAGEQGDSLVGINNVGIVVTPLEKIEK